MKSVLLVPEAGDARPSGRLRVLGYRDLFAAHGIETHIRSRRVPALARFVEQPGAIARILMSIRRPPWLRGLTGHVARARERAILSHARNVDAVFLQKVDSWTLVDALRSTTTARLVYDLNDGLWLPSWSWFADGKLPEILRTVDAATCDNPFGLAYARRYNSNTYLVPDPPQVELYDQRREAVKRDPSEIVLGWVGNRDTAFNLFAIWEPLERLFERFDHITLRLLGVGHDPRVLPRFEKVRYSILPYYSREQLIDEALRMDIGLFPLFDVEDSLARGILKPTVYMSGGACVVTRPIGQNCDLIADGINGVFASTPDEWFDRLSWLVEDHDARRRIAAAGLDTVHEHYTVEQCFDRLMTALGGRQET